MADLKHVGRVSSNKRKVVVAYRVVPNDPESCIVVTTENLPADEHDTLMKLVESTAGQESNELATVMARTRLPDGRIMLNHFHTTGKMVKMPTSQIEMTPNRNTVIRLDQLNELIAKNKGVTVADLAIKPSNSREASESLPTTENALIKEETVLTDEDIAKNMIKNAKALRTEASRLEKEAKALMKNIDSEKESA